MVNSTEPPYLMNSATFTRNTLPQRGATGRIGATHRGIVRETPESVKRAYGVDVTADELARNAVRRSDEAEPDKTEEPALWLHWADHRLREVAARHGCVRRDDATRIITDALALASDDDRTFDLDYLSEIVAREADATTERNNAKMDAQQPSLIDDKKPTGNKSPFGKPVTDLDKEKTTERRAQPPQTVVIDLERRVIITNDWPSGSQAIRKTFPDKGRFQIVPYSYLDHTEQEKWPVFSLDAWRAAERAADLDATPGPDTPPVAETKSPEPEKWYQSDDNLRRFWDGITSEAWAVKFDGNVRELTLKTAGGTLDKWTGTGKELFDAVRELMVAQKPAATVPPRDETPAPATDVPATTNDAPTAPAAAIPATPEPMPEPARYAPVVYGEASVVMYPMRTGELIWRGYRWSLTIRTGATAAEVQNVFAQWETVLAMPGIEIAADARYVAPQPLPQQAAPVTPSAAPVLPTTAAPLPETVPQAAPVTGGAPDKKGRVPGQTGTDRVTAIARNETNGRSVIEVFCGGKWPDHKLRRDEDVAMLRAAFPTLDVAAMAAGAQYPINATCTWVVTNNLNDKGTYWRDVTSIVAATPNL